MNSQIFTYVSYIKTTPERAWDALTASSFTKQYWDGKTVESDWKTGSALKIKLPTGEVVLAGKVLAAERPKVLAYTWEFQPDPEIRKEKPSRVTFTIAREENPELIKLTVVHDDFPANSKMFPMISTGWPKVLSSLKSLLETNEALPMGSCQ